MCCHEIYSVTITDVNSFSYNIKTFLNINIIAVCTIYQLSCKFNFVVIIVVYNINFLLGCFRTLPNRLFPTSDYLIIIAFYACTFCIAYS